MKATIKSDKYWIPFKLQYKQAQEIINNLKEGKQKDDHNLSPPEDLDSELLGEKGEKIWREKLDKYGSEKVNLLSVLIKCLFWDYFMVILVAIFTRLICVLLILESFRRLLLALESLDTIRYVSNLETNEMENFTLLLSSSLSETSTYNSTSKYESQVKKEIMLWTFLLWFMSTVVFAVSMSFLKHSYLRCGLKSRILMSQLIRNKSSRMHLSRSIKDSSSRAVSLISNEVTFIEEAHKMVMYSALGPVVLLVACIWLAYTQVGLLPVLTTLPIILVFVLIQIYMPIVYKRISQKRKLETNKRLDLINTAMSSMKVVKLYAWCRQFKDKINSIRELELEKINLMDRFLLIDFIQTFSSNKLIPSLLFVSAILITGDLDKKVIFSTTVCLTLWRIDFILFFPKGLRAVSDIRTACKNIKQYLLIEEFMEQRISLELNSEKVDKTTRVTITSKNVCVSLKCALEKDSTASESVNKSVEMDPEQTVVINGLSMSVESGDLVFVVGSVGSGKSSLLLTLLSETRIISGQLFCTKGAKFSYASQEACIFSDTLKNNIINGREFDPIRYNKVLEICCLMPDLNQLPNYDQTHVGSNGVALSGGQKARLNLARAVYSNTDVYLLDDPLSALDSRVARDIFINCVTKFLADKLVVIVTHQLQFIDFADKIIFLEQGFKPVFGHKSTLMEEEKFQIKLKEHKRIVNDVADDVLDNNTLRDASLASKSKTTLASGFKATDSRSTTGEQTVYQSPAYNYFFRTAFNNRETLILIPIFSAYLISSSYAEYYYRIWSQNLEKHELENSDKATHKEYMIKQWLWFMLVVLVYIFFVCCFYKTLLSGFRRATKRLHQKLMDSLFKAKMNFFDFCNSGELSSRYAGDFGTIDHELIYILFTTISICGNVFSMALPMSLINPIQIVGLLIQISVLMLTSGVDLRNCRLLMQHDNSLRSPIYTNLASTINDLSTIRSDSSYLSNSLQQFNLNSNKLSSISEITLSYESHFSIKCKIMVSIINGLTLFAIFVVFYEDLNLSSSGAYLTLAISVFNLVPVIMTFGGSLEKAMMSVNNVRILTQIEPELEEEKEKKDQDLISKESKIGSKIIWTKGQVNFKEVTMSYFSGEKPAIRELTFTILAGEKVGIVGRTGAGKSSIVSALFRLYPFQGSILIDGVDIRSLELNELRASLGVIPQDPVLFSDTLRRNLDPSSEFGDDEIWRALEVVNLKQLLVALNNTNNNSSVADNGLEIFISEGGRNFSVGQRQLICLARAILRNPKILLIDEATANVDKETDTFIQKTIKSHFSTSTIITVAHRLDTVLDYDKIMVLDSGQIVEFDSVVKLLELENGAFRSMLECRK